jgi:hypothetical protein
MVAIHHHCGMSDPRHEPLPLAPIFSEALKNGRLCAILPSVGEFTFRLIAALLIKQTVLSTEHSVWDIGC